MQKKKKETHSNPTRVTTNLILREKLYTKKMNQESTAGLLRRNIPPILIRTLLHKPPCSSLRSSPLPATQSSMIMNQINSNIVQDLI